MSYTIFDKSKKIKQIAFTVNSTLFFIHCLLLTIFWWQSVWIMVGVNVISVFIYGVGYWYLRQDRYYVYLAVTHIEIIVHMFCAIACVGWKFGFELYSFAIIPTVYFEFYSNQNKKRRIQYALGISLAIAILYILARVFEYINGPIYPAFWHNRSLTVICYIVNATIAFSFLIYYLTSYTAIVLKSEEALKLVADYDSLTEIYNRRRMLCILEEIFEQADKGSKQFIVSILDVDDFKQVNDTYGHDAGDYVLKRVAKMLFVLSENSQNTTIVGRWGGEEFLIIQLLDRPFSEQPIERLEHIKSRMRKHHFLYKKQEINITVTIGVAEYNGHKSVEELLKQADKNLYEGKAQGRNKVIV